MRVLYEVGNLGISFGTELTRSGIFRATESFVTEVLAHPAVDARFTATDSYLSEVQLARYDRSVHGRLGERLVPAWQSVSPLAESMALVDRICAAESSDTARLRAELALVNRAARPRSVGGSVDVYHSLRQPLAGGDRVTARVRIATIYDMVPSLRPELTEERFVAIHDAVLRSIDFERDGVICNSESTRRDIAAVTGMARDRIFVVPLAASPRIFHKASEAQVQSVREKYGVGDRRYVLSLCTLEPRKNLPRLVAAFARVVGMPGMTDLRLVLAGAIGWKTEPLFAQIAALELPRSSFVQPGHVPDEDLAALLTGASVFAYPSLHEGFGLPVLEAMQCGAPVVTSCTSSLPEVAGDATLTVDPLDEEALAQAIAGVLLNPALADSLRARGLERATTFTHQRMVAETLGAYRELLARAV